MTLFEETRYIHFLRRTREYLSSQPDVTLSKFREEAIKIIDDSKETIKIVVAGEFNSGKSTLINAFLKSQVMPTNVRRETVTVNRLIYGPEYMLVLHFLDTERRSKKIPCTGKADIDEQIREQVNPLAGEISMVDVHYPDERNLHYFSVIDTPGLNFSENDSETTETTLDDADIVIWLTREYYQNEHCALERLRSRKESLKIICVMNYIDMLSEDEATEQFEHIEKMSQGVFDEIFPMSAKWAIEGILSENGHALYEKSRFHDFRGWLDQHVFEEHNNLLLEKIRNETLSFWSLFSTDIGGEIENCQQQIEGTEKRRNLIVEDLKRFLETAYRPVLIMVIEFIEKNQVEPTCACEMAALFVEGLFQYVNANESEGKAGEQNSSMLISWLRKLKTQKSTQGRQDRNKRPLLKLLKKSRPLMKLSPFDALKSESIAALGTELAVNNFLKDIDLLTKTCADEFSDMSCKLKQENTDYASVVSIIENWLREIGPADVLSAYLLGIIHQSGMNGMAYQLQNDSYVKNCSVKLLTTSLDSFRKNVEYIVYSRAFELREATAKRLQALRSALDHLTKLHANLLGD